ncbi:Plastocyanin precursor [Haloferax massiliensis]|uniref:Plastocyanin n=1 Tax=Haloferax massiliensis TaxID=1476858 RepID=A0A0D6JQV3_9EURY|nr:Plastocyanin precursor [Haloferax massiliensis]
MEEANHDLYESFEGALGLVRTAAEEGGDAYGAAKTYGQKAVDSMYAVVATAAADAGLGAAASERMSGVFQTFEEARVHEALEEADHDAYEGFEAALSDYVAALEDGSEVDAAAEAYATATARAQFAVVGEVGKAPAAGSADESGSADTSLTGGLNVVEGVPEDADHAVKMSAVAFEPAELTVSVGDTVAFEHAAGEAHSVTAYGDDLPEGAAYWASGGFESQEAAETGWGEGKGAVQSGQSYVHTFETAGEHAYFCVPHEAAGMTGTVVVEE